MAIHRRSVTIAEAEQGWRIEEADAVRTVPTAAEALATVKAEDAKATDFGRSTITSITWEPSTRFGYLIAKVLTENDG